MNDPDVLDSIEKVRKHLNLIERYIKTKPESHECETIKRNKDLFKIYYNGLATNLKYWTFRDLSSNHSITISFCPFCGIEL